VKDQSIFQEGDKGSYAADERLRDFLA